VGSRASADDVEVLWRVRLALESAPGEAGFPVG